MGFFGGWGGGAGRGYYFIHDLRNFRGVTLGEISAKKACLKLELCLVCATATATATLLVTRKVE